MRLFLDTSSVSIPPHTSRTQWLNPVLDQKKKQKNKKW
jgi:hypothetical protein